MIRKPLVIALSLIFAAALYAQGAKSVKVTGYLMDNACESKDAKTHSTSCALMESCEKAGYSVVVDEKTSYKLNEKGNGMAADLLKNTKTKKGVKVAVEGNYNGDTLDVTKLSEVTP